jgi:hypothetical protein
MRHEMRIRILAAMLRQVLRDQIISDYCLGSISFIFANSFRSRPLLHVPYYLYRSVTHQDEPLPWVDTASPILAKALNPMKGAVTCL